MNKVYLIESLMTSDPYEPSETLVWGIYTSHELAIAAFKTWVKGLQNKLTVQIQEWENQYLGNYKNEVWFPHFEGIREQSIAFALKSLEEALEKDSIQDMYNTIPNDDKIRNLFGPIVSGKNEEIKTLNILYKSYSYWYMFCYWKNVFRLCHVDEFSIVEHEVDQPMSLQ